MKLPTGKDLFFLAAIVVLIILLLTKNWQCKPKDHSAGLAIVKENKAIRDSAAAVDQAKEKRYQQDSARWKGEKDSLNTKLAATYKVMSESQRKTADLSAQVKTSRGKRDTVTYQKACDSLAEENGNLIWLIDQYVRYSDSVTQTNDSLLTIATKRKNEVEGLNKMLLTQGKQSDSLYNVLNKSYLKVSAKAKKKFTVGLGGGYGLGPDGRLQPFIGVTVSRTLLRL